MATKNPKLSAVDSQTGFGKLAQESATGDQVLIRDARPEEFDPLGRMTVSVYEQLPGMPGQDQIPEYYAMLFDVQARLRNSSVRVLVAVDDRPGPSQGKLLGGVTFVGDMQQYDADTSATELENTGGIRLLAVDPDARGRGVGRALTEACIECSRNLGHAHIALHTTRSMEVAWGLYERMGFTRSPDLDFAQGDQAIFGFRLALH